tara:strand:- start:2076 stop:2894 length:819 start_codon:yes stop_codon:yes gene_type:complete
MAKILIPFSGGINSTYALWRYLAETDHEIHSYRHTESFEAQDRKRTAALAMIDWLKTNVRDFTFWEESGTLPDGAEQLEPVRIGFEQTWNVGKILPRWEKQAEILDSVQPDAVVRGYSLEQWAFDLLPVRLTDVRNRLFDRDVDVYCAGHPTLETPIDFMNPVDPATWMTEVWRPLGEIIMGRFEQLEALPQALQDLREKACDVYHPHDGDFRCRECLYEDFLERRTDLTGRQKDQELARLAQYDSGFASADPETYAPVVAICNALVELNDY